MDELMDFFNELLRNTNLNNVHPNINIEENEFLDIRIDFPTPTKNRPNRRSRMLIFRLSEEFIADHRNNMINNIPREEVIRTINSFDFQNRTRTRNESQPSQVFLITTMGEIQPIII
ncbi:Uncharacterised protein [Legionella lansingensis]|uniref:Uncharacterized protein n=1 Tax=Legionella lansingensis TaxID=45067 RepID=A0A0W0VUP8_9GAMM|nr:hypothetical protein [Legionella lansingensis]KTD23899.1 hypothetical protein Llan_0680 [Legionella lansingensis]SNV46406.1 Uncharacterised protein [Legionella lansingensis]